MEEKTLPDYASTGQRLVHRIIDIVLFYGSLLGASALLPRTDDPVIPIIFLGLAFFFPILYYMVCEAVFGKTIGKFITKTTVLKLDGTKPTWTDIFLRTICRLIPLNSISIFFNGYVCWHDKFSGTYVAQDE